MTLLQSGRRWQSRPTDRFPHAAAGGSLPPGRFYLFDGTQISGAYTLKMLFASMITYIFTVTLVRVSILLLYRRLFDVRPFRIITTILIAACVAWGVSMCAANIFQCHSIADAFRPEVVGALDGRCIDLQAMFYGALGTGFSLDLIILVLPLQQVWSLRLERRQKYELTAILALGGL